MGFPWLFTVMLGISSAFKLDIPPSPPPRCRIDLGLVVDTTKSIKDENIPTLKSFLELLVQQFGIAEQGSHVSLETFDRETVVHNKFNDAQYHNVTAVLDLIDTSIGTLRQPTRLDFALETANDTVFTRESGKRMGIRSVMVLFTDGRSHPNTGDLMPFVKALKEKAVRLVIVGIGPDAEKEKYRNVLRSIAGENVIFVADYADLEEAAENITSTICPPRPCREGLDIAFLVDRTQSLGHDNFMQLKGFVKAITLNLEIAPNSTHTGIILFAKTADVLNTFADSEYHSNEAVEQLIDSIPNTLGSKTFIDKALEAADEQLFTVEGGNRPRFPNTLVLLTDGRTNKESSPFRDIIPPLQGKNVTIIAVGIGNYENFLGQLHEIAGEENTLTADDFDKLSDLLDDIIKMACRPPAGSGEPFHGL